MAARLQFVSSFNGVKSKLLPCASAIAQPQSRSSLHTKAASSRWAKTPDNFKNVLTWFAQVKYCFASCVEAPVSGLKMYWIYFYSKRRHKNSLLCFVAESGYCSPPYPYCGSGSSSHAGKPALNQSHSFVFRLNLKKIADAGCNRWRVQECRVHPDYPGLPR